MSVIHFFLGQNSVERATLSMNAKFQSEQCATESRFLREFIPRDTELVLSLMPTVQNCASASGMALRRRIRVPLISIAGTPSPPYNQCVRELCEGDTAVVDYNVGCSPHRKTP